MREPFLTPCRDRHRGARLAKRFGRIDILVNNAGATWGAPFEELPFEAWDKVIRTNVDGTYFVSRAVAMLCSDDAGYITGTTIMLDGGQAYLR